MLEAQEVIKTHLIEAVLSLKLKKKNEKSKIKLKVLFISENFLLLIELQEEFPPADRIVGKIT